MSADKKSLGQQHMQYLESLFASFRKAYKYRWIMTQFDVQQPYKPLNGDEKIQATYVFEVVEKITSPFLETDSLGHTVVGRTIEMDGRLVNNISPIVCVSYFVCLFLVENSIVNLFLVQ